MSMFDFMSKNRWELIQRDKLKTLLMAEFQTYKAQRDQDPQQEESVLTDMRDVPFDSAPPYKCAGKDVHGYTDLLWHIYGDTPSSQLLLLSLVAYEMDRECMSGSHLSLEGAYLQRTWQKITDMRMAVDAPDTQRGRNRGELAKRQERQRVLDECHKNNPTMKICALRKIAAEKLGISVRTLARTTKSPIKK